METKTPKGPTRKQFEARFPTEDACLDHLMRTRYGTRHKCAKCGKDARYYRVKARRSYECEYCAYQVYPTAGTPFEKTRTSLRDWFYVMYMFTTTRNGVAAKRVQREIGVTYKTAWRMCHLIRHYMGFVDGNDQIGGGWNTVQADKTFIGGYDRKGRDDKTVVFGAVEENGDVRTEVLPSKSSKYVHPAMLRNVRKGSRLVTDTAVAFQGLAIHGYQHVMKNHSAGEKTGTATIEGYWSLLKRGINGTYISVSPKHLPSYLREFEFRYNLRKQPHIMFDLLLRSFPRAV
jgi:transposase